MFARPGVTGLAVVLGSISGGLAVRDYDDAGAYQRWAGDHPELARRLPTVRTGRGFHVYCRGPSRFVATDDGEYRATPGHFVLAPPSRHPTGVIYFWTVPL